MAGAVYNVIGPAGCFTVNGIGFGDHDGQPRAVEIGLTEGGVLNAAIAESRPVTTRQEGAQSPGFANLADGRLGLAIPVNVGGRAVAVVYATLDRL